MKIYLVYNYETLLGLVKAPPGKNPGEVIDFYLKFHGISQKGTDNYWVQEMIAAIME